MNKKNKLTEQMELFEIGPSGQRVSTGNFIKRGTAAEKGLYVVGVNNWIINSEGKILVQKRSRYKKNNPSKWSSTNGLIIPGEKNIDTVIRETKEELGITLDKNKIIFIESRIADENLIVDIFISFADIDISKIKLQKEEVEEFRLVSKEELLELDISTTCQYIKEKGNSVFDYIS